MTAEEVVNLAFEMSTGRIESEKERKEYMKKAFTIQMITEYQFRHNLECLQELYESAGFKDNRKLAERLRTDRKILFGPYENMYIDMIHLLADEIIVNKELADQYISIFEKRYNINARSIVEKMSVDHIREQMGKEKVRSLERTVQKMTTKYFGILHSYPLAEEQFLVFAILYMLPVSQIAFPVKHSDDEYDRTLTPFVAGDVIDKMYDGLLSEKMDWCESFLESDVYRKYIRKRISELAEAYDTDTSGLVSMIESFFSKDANVEEHYLRTVYMFRRHHLSFHWREQVLYDSNGKMKYKPDVMGIMEDYYRSCVIGCWLEEKCSEITKAGILGTKTEDPERDMDNIRGMCEVDVICQMYQDLLEEYYMNFSFDLLSNERMQEKYEKQLKDAEKEASVQNSHYQELQKENERLMGLVKNMGKDADAAVRQYRRETSKELETVSAENEKLKGLIKSQEEYIEALEKEEETVKMFRKPIYDLPALQSKKYLFVGHMDNDFGKLKKKFPNSVFMTENTDNISNINVDAIVYLIKCMSHSMYYKVQNQYGSSGMPIIRYNGNNLELLYQEMQKVIGK